MRAWTRWSLVGAALALAAGIGWLALAVDAPPDGNVTGVVVEQQLELQHPAPQQQPTNQGLSGRVIGSDGTALRGADVFVMPGSTAARGLGSEPHAVPVPPIAHAQTDATGAFRVAVPQGGHEYVYELRVVASAHAEWALRELRLERGEWFDVGSIQLESGIVLHGRVTAAADPMVPVPGVRIRVLAEAEHTRLTPTPGLEQGLLAETDEQGRYRVHHVPGQRGTLTVLLERPGYAARTAAVEPHAGPSTRADFELAMGRTVSGRVRGPSGAPVAGARITTVASGERHRYQCEVVAGEDGRFRLTRLSDGPHALHVRAAGLAPAMLVLPPHSDEELDVVLQAPGHARLQLFAKSGQPLTATCRLELRSFFTRQHEPGPTTRRFDAQPDRHGLVTVHGIDPFDYVFLVEADGHAIAFSEPFRVEAGKPPPFRVVRLDEGGSLTGTIITSDGSPVRGAIVETFANVYEIGAFPKRFASLLAPDLTRKSMQTDAAGRFRFSLLAPGACRLRVSHPGFGDLLHLPRTVHAGHTTDAGRIVLDREIRVSGTVVRQGLPVPMVELILEEDVVDYGYPTPPRRHWKTFANGRGEFRFLEPIPPGHYDLYTRPTLGTNRWEPDILWWRRRIELDPDTRHHRVTFVIR